MSFVFDIRVRFNIYSLGRLTTVDSADVEIEAGNPDEARAKAMAQFPSSFSSVLLGGRPVARG